MSSRLFTDLVLYIRMSWRPFTTTEDFSETKQDFDQIPIVNVSYASSYLALLQCNLVEHPIMDTWEELDTRKFLQHGNTLPKLHQINGITYNSNPNATHGGTITSSDAYHKAIEWFLHHMNSLVLFKRYIRSLDILELNVLIAFSLLITIGEVCMFKSKMSLLGVNNVIEWKFPFPFDSSHFFHSLFKAYSKHILSLVM
jgi:hypothetical protein